MSSVPLAIRTGANAIPLRRRPARGAALAGLLTGASAVALPVPVVAPVLPIPAGGTVQAEGLATISTDMSVSNPRMTVDLLTPAGRTVIDWQSFDIGKTETVHFRDALSLPGAVAVLNRVVGPAGNPAGLTQSRILGTLSSDNNVSVFLLNQQGILFGAGSRVQVGSLIASTLPIDESLPDPETGATHQRAFLTGSSRTFRGTSSGAIEIENDANLRAIGGKGVIALVGARIENGGALTANGEVALVTASDATVNFDPSSPLSIVIREGTSLANPMVLRGTVNGSSILIAGATRDDVTASVLNVQAALTATSAFATDQGIVLVAGRTASLPDTVTMPIADAVPAPPAPTGTAGGMILELGGTLDMKAGGSFVAGPIDIRAADGIRTATADVAGALAGGGAVQVRADRGAITLGRIAGTTIAVAGNAAVGTMDIVAGGDVAISGASVTLGRATTTAGTMALTATGGNLNATAAGSTGDLTLRAEGGIRIAGKADSAAAILAEAGAIDIDAIDAGTTLRIRGGTGTTRIGTGNAGTLATIGGQADVAIDTLDAATIAVTAQGGLTANRLTATRTSSTDAVLTATAGTLAIGTAAAPNAGVSLTTTTGAATVRTITAAQDGVLLSAGRATLSGAATVGRDLSIGGADVRLGGSVPATQQAGRTASYTATIGTVAAVTDATGLTIRADAGGTGAGSVLLDAATGIDTRGVTLVTGIPMGTVNSGDVGIRLSGAAAALTLGTLEARALLSVARDHATFTPLTVGGAVTLGTTRLVNGLALSTPETIRLDAIAIGGAGQALRVTGTGGATTIAATGTLSATGGVTVRAPGTVMLADITGGTGAVVESTGAALTAGAVTGGTVTATARTALALGRVEAATGAATLTSQTAGIRVTGATRADGPVAIDAPGDVTLAGVTSERGAVRLASTSGTVTVTGATQANGLVSIDGATLALGSVESVDGTISLLSRTGMVTAGTLVAQGRVSVLGETGVMLGGVTSNASTTDIFANGGAIRVTGAIETAGGIESATSGDARYADVTSRGSTVVLRSNGGSLTTGAVRTNGLVTLAADRNASIASAASTTDSVSIVAATGRIDVAGAVEAGTVVVAEGDGDTTLGSVTASGMGTSILRARTGVLTVAGATKAAGGVMLSGATGVGTGAVETANGSVDVRSDAGDIVTGALSGTGVLVETLSGDARIAGVTTTTGAGSIRTGGTMTVTGAVSTGSRFDAVAGDGLDLGAVTSRGDSVFLQAGTALKAGAVSAGAALSAISGTQAINAGDADMMLESAHAETLGVTLRSPGAIGISGTTTARGAVDVLAQDAVTLGDATSTESAVSLISGMASVKADAAHARTALSVLGATDVTLGSAASDRAAIALTATDGTVRVADGTTAEAGITALGNTAIVMGDVTSRTAGVALRSGGGSVRAGGVTASTPLDVTAESGIMLNSATSQAGAVTLATMAGTLDVTGATRARGDVTIAARETIRLGDVTSDSATVAITSRAGSAGARDIVAAQAIRVTGQIDVAAAGILPAQAGVSLRNATATGGPVILTAVAGGVTATGTVRAAGDIVVDARDAVVLGTVTTDPGAVTIGSRTGAITADTVAAAGNLTVIANGNMVLTRADTRSGAADLRSVAGEIRIAGIATGTTLTAVASQALSIDRATVGTLGGQRAAATLTGGNVEVGGIDAGSLDMLANGGTLTLGAGDSAGAARLTKTGATGAIAIGRLTAGGPTRIDSDGAVRVDRLEGGSTTITARGDVTGRQVTGPSAVLTADVADLRVSAGGGATIGMVASRGDVTVIAAGDAALLDRIDSAGDLTVTGGSVLLGNAARAVRQTAAGAVRVTSTAGTIDGLAGLTLVSDAGGAGGRDLTLASADAIRFQAGSTLLGGPDRQSAVRVGAGPAAAIVLDGVMARTIASPGAGDTLAHDGAVTIASATTRDPLAIALTGMATPLTIGTATVSAGNLSLESTGALDAARLTAAAGTVTLAGASLRNDGTAARGVTATARTGAATFDQVDATAGAFVATAATDLRIARATASDAVQLTSLRGDVTGAAASGGFGAAMLTGDRVTVRADAADGISGLVRIGTVGGTSGVDLAGRAIIAETVRAAAGPVEIDTRRDSAGSTDQRLAIGTIDAGGAITLGTGNRVTRADGSIAIDRATSRGGAIRIETIGGGIASRDPAMRTVLTAPAGAITLDIDGAALLGTVTAGPALAMTATSLDVGTAMAAGTVMLATRGGPLTLGTATGDGALSIETAGSLETSTIEAASVTLASMGDATLGRVLSRSGAIDVAAGGALDATALDGATDVTVAAATARITDVGARGGALSLTARGRLRVDSARAATDAMVTAPTLSVGTLASGRAATLVAGEDMDVSGVTAGTTLSADAGRDAVITMADAGGELRLSAGRQVTVGRLATLSGATLSGRGVSVSVAAAGTLTAAAGADGLVLNGADVAGPAVLRSDGAIAIGSLAAGDATLSALTGLTADRLTLGATLAADAGTDMTVATVQAGGAVTLAAGEMLTVGGIVTPSALTLTGRRIAVTRADAGPLRATAGAGGIDVRGIGARGTVAIRSDAGIAIGALAADDATLTAAGGLDADRLTTRTALSATAGTAMTIATIGAGGDVALRGTERVALGTVATPTALTIAGRRIAIDGVTAGTLDMAAGVDGAGIGTGTVRGVTTIASQGGVTIGTLAAGRAEIAAGSDLSAGRLVTAGTVLAVGDAVRIATVEAGGEATLTGTRLLTIDAVTTPVALTLRGAQVAVGALDAGTLAVTAGAAGLDLRTARVAGMAQAGSEAGVAIGVLDAGSIDLAAAGTIMADRLVARVGLDVTAMEATIVRAEVAGGTARVATGAGGATLGAMTAAGDTVLTTAGSLDAGAIAIGGGLTVEAASARFATVTAAHDATLTARAGELRIGTATLGGAGMYRGRAVLIGSSRSGGALAIAAADRIAAETLEVDGRLAIDTAALTLGTATVRGGDAVLTLGGGQIGGITGAADVRLAVADALVATRLDAGGALDVRAGSAAIAQAAARGGDVTLATTTGALTLGTADAAGAVAMTSSGASRVTGAVAAGGAYRIAAASIAFGTVGATTRQSGADVAMVARSGTIAAEGATTLAAGRTLSLTANGIGGGIAFAPETVLNSTGTGIALATTGTATLGTVRAATGEVRVVAADVALTRAVSANRVVLANVATAGLTRLGDSAVGNEGAFDAAGGGFALSNGEIALVAAPIMTIAGGARDVVVGAVGLAAGTGATRFAITTRGRIDMLGRFVAAGSTAARTIAIGGDGAGARSDVLRIAATQAAGGRLLVDDAVLTLSADRIGAGLDRDFLDPIGYRGANGLSVEQVTRDYVARPTSTLYAPGAFGAQPYDDGVLLRSGTLTLDYGRYALFQNTALPGQQRGVVIGSAGGGGTALRLSTTGSAANAFALFGTINGIGSAATALLGGETLAVDGTASPVASRINGCVIGSGGGCLNTSIAQPSLNLFDTSRAEIVRTADDLSLPFDPLIGTNNEALYLDTGTDAAALPTACEGDTPCPTQP